ncbi:MAG: tyrosine-type recombinase/integrase [Coriobacteriales bacterium]
MSADKRCPVSNRKNIKLAKAKREGAWEPYTEEQVVSWENRLDVVERTKQNYRLGLASFCEFARACGVASPAEVDEDLVLGFKDFLQEYGRSSSCVSLYLAGVRSFLNSLGGENPAARVRGGKAKRGFKKEALSLDEARRLLTCYPGSNEASVRNRTIISLMLHTGLRDIEVVRANVGDRGTDSGHRVLHIQGKGRDEADAIVKLTPAVNRQIDEYLALRENAALDQPLFTSLSNNNRGGRLTTYTVSSVVKSALRQIGIDDPRYTAHSLRHTAITLALIGGATDAEAKEMARHADISTTMIYSHHINRLEQAAEDRVSQLLDD